MSPSSPSLDFLLTVVFVFIQYRITKLWFVIASVLRSTGWRRASRPVRSVLMLKLMSASCLEQLERDFGAAS
jgi:hypothetical protein